MTFGLEGALNVTGERASDYNESGRRQFRLNMELIVAACKITGATPVLVTQATLVVSDNSARDRDRINYDYQNLQHDAIVRAFEETYEVIRNIGSHNDTMVIDTAPALNGRSELFSDHVHLTPQGSSVLAGIVADELAPILMNNEKFVD